MVLPRCRVLSIALAMSVVAFAPSAVRAQTRVEVYPGPGVDTYKSRLYQVEVLDGANWIPAYVYQFGRKSVCHWHYGANPTVSFVTFGTSGATDVRVTRLAGPIHAVDVSPHARPVSGSLSGGQAVGTVLPNDKLWLTIDGDDANPLFVFADPLKPSVPAGATYFGPGVRDIAPGSGNHYKASSNEVIYLDGGAWVRGNIDVHGTSGVRIMGPGVLSGDLWTGEAINPLPFDQFGLYSMIVGDFYGGNGATVEGITILDSPGYNIFGGIRLASGIKILSPWFFSTDGFQGVPHVDHVLCFNGDNVFFPAWAGVQGESVTFTSSFAGTTNNSVFSGGFLGRSPSDYTSLADDIDIKTYNNDDWVSGGGPMLAGAVTVWMDTADSTKGYANQTYQNIRVEGNLSVPLLQLKNTIYPWGGGPNPPLGNSRHIVFRNVSLEGTQKYRSEIKGWDANNGFHDVVLDGVKLGGQLVTSANLSQYFDVNAFVSGLQLGPGTSCVTDAATLCLADGRFQVRATYDSGAAAGSGTGVPLTGDTGYFWFFSPDNIEIVVKVLNACGVNQNYWVFAGGLTNVGVGLTVTDTKTGASHAYQNARGASFQPLQRTADFGVCP